MYLGDFNKKSNSWFKNDTLKAITYKYGLYKAIQEATHLLDSSSSCIDLIFTS